MTCKFCDKIAYASVCGGVNSALTDNADAVKAAQAQKAGIIPRKFSLCKLLAPGFKADNLVFQKVADFWVLHTKSPFFCFYYNAKRYVFLLLSINKKCPNLLNLWKKHKN